MVLMVLSHLATGAAALGCGLLLSSTSRRAVRRRAALRWAFETAQGNAERAREREASIRAELRQARAAEQQARDEAEATKALATTLEAEVVAARWEKEELDRRSRAAREEIEKKAQGIASLHAALLDAVHRAVEKDERAERLERAAHAHRASRDPVELVTLAESAAGDAPVGAKVLPFAVGR